MKMIGGTCVLVDKKILLEHFKKVGKKCQLEELKKIFEIKGEEELKEFNRVMKSLEYDGDLYLDEKGFYHIFDEKIPLKQGVIHINRSGAGFVNIVENGKTISYFIEGKDLNGALPKDLVIISPRKKKFLGHQLAIVEKVLKRDDFLEIFEYQGNGIFTPYEVLSNFKVKSSYVKDLVPQSLVLMEVGTKPDYIDDELYFKGEVKRMIGHRDDPKVDEKAVCLKYGFDAKFSPQIMKVVNSIPNHVLDEELEGRIDLRDKMIFTIDGKDTKDMDDAISIEKDGDDYILSVHIADVSHYLLQHPILIDEVIRRGNSAYIADSVVPMLPHKMSNGICSLNPGEDRLTKTVEMRFNKYGELVDFDVYKSVIQSRKKMNYDDVNAILEQGTIPNGYEDFVIDLLEMSKLSDLLTKIRGQRGCMVLDDVELKIYTDTEGNPIRIKRCVQKRAEHLIENFMIMANIVVTENYGYLGQPFIYRVHEAPDLAKLQATLEVIRDSNVVDDEIMEKLLAKIEKLRNNHSDIRPVDLQPLLLAAKESGNLTAISNLLLRSMKKAIYLDENIGHFGLAEDDYSHFTSPIRRTADAINHILIDFHMQMLQATTDAEVMMIQEKINGFNRLKSICEHISEREVAAFEAEKEVEEIKTLKYVATNIDDYIGPLEAQVCRANKFGMDVLVDSNIRAIIDSGDLSMTGFNYMRDSHTYVRKSSHDKFKLGTRMYVFDPEVSVQHRCIYYHTPMTTDEYQEGFKEKPKKLIKSVNVKGA